MTLTSLLPGLWVLALAALLAWILRRWFDAIPARCWAAWGIVLALMFGAVLFGGRVMLPLGYLTRAAPFTGLVRGQPPPGNLLQSDLVLQIAPWLERVRAAYAAGEWPLWNPLSGAGEPLLANPQSQAFQPLVWLALPFPVAASFGVIAALRVLLAFAFTYLLLRRQGLSDLPALAGSLAYGLAGFLQLFLGWPMAGSASLLPALLYGLVLVDQRGTQRDGLFLAVAVTATVLVGHPETTLHLALLSGAFAFSRLLARPAGRRLELVKSWAVPILIGLALAAPVVLPAVEYLPQSLRASLLETRRERLRGGDESADESPESGVRQRDSIARLVPNAAPNAFGNNLYGRYWGNHNINADAAGFAGTATLLAALGAALTLRRRAPFDRAGRAPTPPSRPAPTLGIPSERHLDSTPFDKLPQERLMLGTALVCLAILARPPGLAQLFNLVPVLRDSVSFHSRVSLLLNFTLAYAAACTWERWQRGEVRARRTVLLAAALTAVIVWAYLAHSGPDPDAFAWLRYGSLTVQLTALTAASLLLAGRFSARRGWGLALVVAAELMAFHAPAHPPVSAHLYYPETPPITFLRQRLDPWHRMTGLGTVLRPNFASVYGFADPRSSNPAKPAAYAEAIQRINRLPRQVTDDFVSPDDPLYARLGVRFLMTEPGTQLPQPYQLVRRRRRAWIYENRAAPALLFLPDSATLEPGTMKPDWMQARVRLSERRMLASSVYQDGNWKLLIDGKNHPSTLADGPFLAAWLPPGEARIDLVYRPGSFAAGLALAALGLAAGIVLWVPPPHAACRSQTQSQPST